MAKSRRELLAEHSADLDAQWHEKWPFGRFIVGRWTEDDNLDRYALVWESRRSTPAVKHKGVSVFSHDPYGKEGPFVSEVVQLPPRHSGIKTTYHPTLGSMLHSVRRRDFPDAMIDKFTEAYNAATATS